MFGCNFEKDPVNIFSYLTCMEISNISCRRGSGDDGGGGTKEWKLVGAPKNQKQKTFSSSFGLFSVDFGKFYLLPQIF